MPAASSINCSHFRSNPVVTNNVQISGVYKHQGLLVAHVTWSCWVSCNSAIYYLHSRSKLIHLVLCKSDDIGERNIANTTLVLKLLLSSDPLHFCVVKNLPLSKQRLTFATGFQEVIYVLPDRNVFIQGKGWLHDLRKGTAILSCLRVAVSYVIKKTYDLVQVLCFNHTSNQSINHAYVIEPQRKH